MVITLVAVKITLGYIFIMTDFLVAIHLRYIIKINMHSLKALELLHNPAPHVFSSVIWSPHLTW